MNKKNLIDPAIIAKHRATLATWNLIGKRIFTVKSEPADLEWNEKVRNNESLRLVKPIMKYMVESVDIVSARVVVLPDDTTTVIELNNDTNLQFKLAPAKFQEVTMDAIREAIDYNNDTLGREPILFTDCLRLTEQVNKLNQLEKAKAEKLAEEMMNTAELLGTLNKMQLENCDKYYDELGTPISGKK